MDSLTQLNVAKTENDSPEFDWLQEDSFEKLLELPPLVSLLDCNDLNPLPISTLQCQSNNIDFKDLDDLGIESNGFSSLYGDAVTDVKPLACVNPFENNISVQHQNSPVHSDSSSSNRRSLPARRKKSCDLDLEEIRKYFDVPIARAAKEMRVGVTVLKKRCRELNIMRWPHRKIKSLKALINNVKELGMNEEVVMLEEHKKLVEDLPDMELTERTKKLRQACFKANYKKRRSLHSPSHRRHSTFF